MKFLLLLLIFPFIAKAQLQYVPISSPIKAVKINTDTLLTKYLKHVDGTQGANKTLISDVDGVGSWQATAGTYTPTLTNISNVSSSTAYRAHWTRNSNEVTVYFRIDITATTVAATSLTMSLPPGSSSTFADEYDAVGNFTGSTAVTAYITASGAASTTVTLSLASTVTTSQGYFGSFRYTVK